MIKHGDLQFIACSH